METTERVLRALETGGLLLMQDKSFPNLVALVTGGPLVGSWWAHPRGHEIFRSVSEIAACADVLVTKLLEGKVTFVHRRLWPEVLAVARAREPWQTAGIVAAARALWQEVEQAGSLVASGPDAKEIERRLLVHGEEIHTDAGSHKTRLETWLTWSQRSGCSTDLLPEEGRSSLERAVEALGGSVESLPWHHFRAKPARRRRATGP